MRDKRGAVAVEYAMILVAFVVPSAAAIFYQGSLVYKQYTSTRSWELMPIP